MSNVSPVRPAPAHAPSALRSDAPHNLRRDARAIAQLATFAAADGDHARAGRLFRAVADAHEMMSRGAFDDANRTIAAVMP